MNKKKSEVILPSSKNVAKKPRKVIAKRSSKNMSVYSSLNYKHKAKKDLTKRKYAEELARMPKQPVKRFFYKLAPKRVFRWWFSWRGQKAILKFCAACFLLLVIFIGGLFLYYKKDLLEIQLDEMQISETVNTYLDRNGLVLWRDTGNEDYRLVVDGSEINDYMKQATIAIEDRHFYNHIGVDFTALVRATFSTLTGRGVQGGSTLTQQLIKQVYFSDEAASKNRGGVTRKIKELILSIELERMYSKDEILVMYLNQSPYGGRRNGVESAARTYFGKSSSELTLAEAALLASVPNSPAYLNPYNEYGHEALIARQKYCLDVMAEMGYITSEEAEAAKEVDILATIRPESSQYSDMIAPHFVLEVKSQLEDKYGISTMRAGGWTITTTLDYYAQITAEQMMNDSVQYMSRNGSDNMALVSVDVETSQVIAMIGSVDFNNPEYGELNATTQLLEPGSSIKPVLDYAPLFMEREGINYSAGTFLKDENIDEVYCETTYGRCQLRNATGIFYPTAHVRQALGSSLNIPAVKALKINGIGNSLDILHKLGDVSYCEYGEVSGLSIAIGTGCRVRMVEHANTYASIARGGAYKDLAYILEVKNSSGDVIERWEDKPAVQVIDPEVAYIISDILSDPSARTLMGWSGWEIGYNVPGVWTACKTGTTTGTSLAAKDSWLASYSTAIATVVWNGNHDGAELYSSDNLAIRNLMGKYMENVHKNVLSYEGKWNAGDQPHRPAGIKTLTINGYTDIYPSWYDVEENSGYESEEMEFNKYTKTLAAECTPDDYRIKIDVKKFIDPVSKTETYEENGYNHNIIDSCSYESPSATIEINSEDKLIAKIKKGTYEISSIILIVDGETIDNISIDTITNEVIGYELTGDEEEIALLVTDTAGYTYRTEV